MTFSKNRYKYTENIPELYVNSMDAKKVLEKYGWKEGQGLGKEGHGRAEPIKVFMKRDNGGVGLEPGKEFSDHWWSALYNKTAGNICVETTKDGVKVKGRNKHLHYSLKQQCYDVHKTALKYGGFLESTSIAIGDKLVKENHGQDCNLKDGNEDDINIIVNNDDLLTACGGRTAHKAARHGFKLSGKLQRIKEQELKLYESCCELPSDKCERKIKKRKRTCHNDIDEEDTIVGKKQNKMIKI